MQYSEDKLQQQIVVWFRNHFCLKHHNPRFQIFSVPNGGTRNKIEAIKLKSTGLLPGVSDLIVVMDTILFVEVKTPTGTQSSRQKEFEKAVEHLGHKYVIVKSLDEFKKIINGYIVHQ